MSALSPPDERELTLFDAHVRIHQELASLGLSSTLHVAGNTVVNARVLLSSSDASRQTGGSGKGYKEAACTGAYFEALEHYLTEFHGKQAPIELIPAHHFSRRDYLTDDSVLDVIYQDQDSTLACRRYTSPLDDHSFCYPLALSLPGYSEAPVNGDTFNYASLKRYCCNSGIAIGATWNEAVLHAINECLERDALSLFLLHHFYYLHDHPLRMLNRPAAHEPLFQLWSNVEKELDTQVIVLDISSEFLARTYLAFTVPCIRPVGLFGSGTSLCPEHAVSRALTELAQMVLAVQQPDVARLLRLQDCHLAPFPRLQRCLQLDTDDLLARAVTHRVQLPVPQPKQPVSEHIRRLAEDIRSHQKELGVSVMYHTALGTTLANVVIPGLERFYIVTSGNVVIPQARGLQLHELYG